MFFAPLIIPFIFSAAVAVDDPAPRVHADEVRAFSYAVVLASMVSDVCSNIDIDTGMLRKMQQRFHIVEADADILNADRQKISQELFDRMAHAENRGAWCDATYRSFGPNGSVLPDLLKR